MGEACVKQCYEFATFYRRRGGMLNTLFKISHNVLSLIVRNLNMEKERGGSMHAI